MESIVLPLPPLYYIWIYRIFIYDDNPNDDSITTARKNTFSATRRWALPHSD